MARQLFERGMQVDLLFIIDASPLNARRRWIWNLIALLGAGLRFNPEARTDGVNHARRWMNRWQEISRDGKRSQALFVTRKLQRMLEGGFRPVETPPRLDPTIPRGLDRDERYRVYRPVMTGYIPGHYSGRVVLLRAESIQSRTRGDPALGWRHVTSNLEVHPIPGDHHTCLTEHVKTLAES